MRLLVAGSRGWSREDIIIDALRDASWESVRAWGEPLDERVVLVHGACPTGADAMAQAFAKGAGWEIESHPAQWNAFGKSAGPIRNEAMVERGADLCLVFIKNGSRGSMDLLGKAKAARIPTAVYRMN